MDFLNLVIGFVWIKLIVVETENWKHYSKIIFKCVNSVVRPVNSAWTVCEQCFCPLHNKFMWSYCSRARGGKKGLNTQTWVWKCGSKPTLNGVLPFNVYTYIFQLSTTPNHLFGHLSLRQMLKVILAQGFFLAPQLKAHKLNATVNAYYFYTIIWGYSALVLKVMAQKKIWC